MKIFQVFKYLTVDPVNLSAKAKYISLLACFCSIFFIAMITRVVSPWPGSPMLVASMGASAIILFFIPGSPLAQPWPFIGGQLVSALVGMFCALNIVDVASAAASAVGGSIALMLIFRCLHPPGAATSLTPVMAGASITHLGYSFVIVPVAVNVIIMFALTIFINRWVMNRPYPNPLPAKKTPQQRHEITEPYHRIGFAEQDFETAIQANDVVIDVTAADLSQIFSRVEHNAFKRLKGNISCAEIMIKDFASFEFGTDIEDAWRLMHEQQLKAVPVTDRARRIIGIITLNDFIKHVDLNVYESFPDKLRGFIRRTTKINAAKPESVGQIMTESVVILSETTHIAELIPLMSTHGHRQIPIVNNERRLVGIVYQANLIAALYNEQIALNYR